MRLVSKVRQRISLGRVPPGGGPYVRSHTRKFVHACKYVPIPAEPGDRVNNVVEGGGKKRNVTIYCRYRAPQITKDKRHDLRRRPPYTFRRLVSCTLDSGTRNRLDTINIRSACFAAHADNRVLLHTAMRGTYARRGVYVYVHGRARAYAIVGRTCCS